MAKNIFDPKEVIQIQDFAVIEAPEVVEPEPEEVERAPSPSPAELYTGPQMEDLQREADEFKANWAQEKESIIKGAAEQADAMIADAKAKMAEMLNSADAEAEQKKSRLEEESKSMLEQAAQEAENIKIKASQEAAGVTEAARAKGFEEGRSAGYKEGYAEAERLAGRLQTVINKTVEKRNDLFQEAEAQLVNLALLMVRKVVKTIAANQKEVVANNIIEALRKVKSRGDITIRVNLADLNMTTQHKKDFIKELEGGGNVNIVEDSSVDQGGAIIETDFGELDARISSQLNEIESRIQDLMPIGRRSKGFDAEEEIV